MSGQQSEGFFNPFGTLKDQLQERKQQQKIAPKTQTNTPVKPGQAGGTHNTGCKVPTQHLTSQPKQQTTPDAVSEKAERDLFLRAMQGVEARPRVNDDADSKMAFMREYGPTSIKQQAHGSSADPAEAAAQNQDHLVHSKDVSLLPATPKEDDEFLQAMMSLNGIVPVEAGGRAVKPVPPVPMVASAPSLRDPTLRDFLEGKFEFALEYTDEFFEGHVLGLDPIVISKLRNGQYSPELHTDLHGMNSEQAYDALLDFVHKAYAKGMRTVIVVTGRGKNSPGGQGILRQHIQDWLTKDPLKRVVLAFCTAQPKDGGAGAFYLLLRKYRKSRGKIIWERRAWSEDVIL